MVFRVNEANFVDVTIAERLGHGPGDVAPVLDARTVGDPLPRVGFIEFVAPELEIRDRLLADQVEPVLVAVLLHAALGEPQHVRVVRTGKSSVRGHDNCGDRGDLIAPLQQRMVDLSCVGRDRGHETAHLLGVWTSGLDSLLGLDHARRGDEFHRARDLLRRLDARDPALDRSKLLSHLMDRPVM
jgi:hypothetical protein